MNSKLRTNALKILRWSEKYTKTDMVYLTKGSFWLLLGNVLQGGSGLLLAIAFANFIPKEVYGTYQFIMSASIIISAFTLTGLQTAITRAVARGSEGALRAGFRAQMKWSLLIIFIAAIGSTYYFLNENNTLAICFIFIGVFSPFLEGFSLSQSYLVGKQFFRETALMGFGRRLIPLVAILFTIFSTQNPVVIIFVYFLSHTISAGLLYGIVTRRYNLPLTHEPEMVNYSKHLSLFKTLSDIVGQVDKVLIWMFLGAAPLAVYTLAQLPIIQIQGIFKLIRSLSAAKFAKIPISEIKKTLPRKVRIFFFATLIIALFYAVCAPFLFKLLFPMYPEAIAFSQVLALSLIGSSGIFYSQALTGHGKKMELYIMSITQTILRITLLVILLPLYGIWGAIAASVFNHLYINVLVRILFNYAK